MSERSAPPRVETRKRPLPDVNAETYPYDFVQHLLDQTANFSLFAIPDPAHAEVATLTPGQSDDYFGLQGGYGVDISCILHRFEAVVEPAGGSDLGVAQRVGEGVGRLRCRWLFGPENLAWEPGREPPPAIFDPWRSQRFAMLDVTFGWGGEDGFTAYGIGRTFPISFSGRPQLLAGVVGDLRQGKGRFCGLAGTFVLTGTLTPELGFLGNVTCRVVDPEGRIRTEGELPELLPVAEPNPDFTFVVLRGEKRDRSVKTTYGPPPDAERVSLITPSQMRAMRFGVTREGGEGLRTSSRVHQVVGTMEADVSFNLLAPPGTPDSPVPFTTDEIYTFVGRDGKTIGTVTARVIEGISFDLKFPTAPGQPGVRFAGFGPVTGGTGAFADAQGILTVNSLIGIAPHALSLLHVLNLVDPEGRSRTAGTRPSLKPGNIVAVGQLSPGDPFHSAKCHKEEYTATYLRWRDGFRRCSGVISTAIAEEYNRRLQVGDFPGLPIDAAVLREIFERPVAPFNPELMNRYSGAAKGTFRFYELATHREIDSNVLYSFWHPNNLLFDDGRIAKKISGSFAGYFHPESLPPLEQKKVDIILNSYRRDLGTTSWVEIFQGKRQQRTSIAFTLPAPHEILWFVKDVSFDDVPVADNVFMASHEWRGHLRGKTCYFLVGIWFEIDFERCVIRLSGDRFWRALYEEEPEARILGV